MKLLLAFVLKGAHARTDVRTHAVFGAFLFYARLTAGRALHSIDCIPTFRGVFVVYCWFFSVWILKAGVWLAEPIVLKFSKDIEKLIFCRLCHSFLLSFTASRRPRVSGAKEVAWATSLATLLSMCYELARFLFHNYILIQDI